MLRSLVTLSTEVTSRNIEETVMFFGGNFEYCRNQSCWQFLEKLIEISVLSTFMILRKDFFMFMYLCKEFKINNPKIDKNQGNIYYYLLNYVYNVLLCIFRTEVKKRIVCKYFEKYSTHINR